MVRFDFVELFAGIGGFRLALEAVGGRCVLASEYSQHACAVYRRNWPNDPAHVLVGDVRKLVPAQIPPHDVLVGGFPCQSFSNAGRREGLDDDRGSLFFEVVRLLDGCRPRAFLLENVRGLLKVMGTVRARLCALGRSLGAPRPRASRLDPRHAPRSARLRALTPEEEARYFTLGVSPGASAEAVKRAYKRLAKQYHPDVCDAPDADARFAEIKSAYETLAAERGVLGNVGTEEWRAKWSAQLRQMRDVEQGRGKVNVRRRRVVRAWAAAIAARRRARRRRPPTHGPRPTALPARPTWLARRAPRDRTRQACRAPP